MRWISRLLGLAVIFGLLGWSFNYSLGELDQITNRDPDTAVDLDNEVAVIESTEGIQAPQYLAFVGGIPSGRYRVADLPGTSDWDYGERAGRTPQPATISEGNPVNDNVEVEDSAYVTTVGAGEDESGDNDDGTESDESSAPSIKPGLYATQFGMNNCEYELRRIMDDNRDHVIGHDHVQSGRMLVTLDEYEPDTFVATESCGEWTPWSPLVEPLTIAGDGDYWVGDLAIGIWNAPSQCLWEKVIGFRGAQLEDVEQSGIGPQTMTIDQFTLGVRIRHCGDEPMTLSDVPLPPQLQIVDLEAAKEAAHRNQVTVDLELTSSEARRLERRRR